MNLSREEWLENAAEYIVLDILAPVTTISDEMKIKTSVGYAPNTRASSKVIGVCIKKEASAEGYNEIFISPQISDSMKVLETLVHELIHALDNCASGHTGAFKRVARKVGLEGPLTATHASEALREQLSLIVNEFGPIPHAKIDLKSIPKQVNRNLKVWCECGFKFNTSRTQIQKVIAAHSEIQCPHCFKAMQANI